MATTAKINIEADVSQANAAIKSLISSFSNVESAVGKMDTNMRGVKSTTDGLASSFKGLIGALGVREIVRFADGFTQLQNQLKSGTTSNEQFGTALASVQKIANETGTPLAQVGQLYTKLSVSAQTLGISQDRVANATMGISKQMKLFGLDAANAQSVMYQFGQAVGLGVARTEEMKQIMEASPQFVKKMAEAFGKTVPQFMADVAAYKVGAEDLIAAQERMADSPMWKDYQQTVGDAITKVSNNFQIFLGRLEAGTGIFRKIAGAIEFMGENLDIVAGVGVFFFSVFAIKKLMDLGTAFATLNGIMKANPWVLLATVLASAGVALYSYMKTSDAATEVINKETEAQTALNEETLKYKGPQIDVGALTTAAEALAKQQNLLAGIAGLNKYRQEQEKAVMDFAKAQNMEYAKVPGSVAAILKNSIAVRQNAEIQKSIQDEILSLTNEIEITNARGIVQQEQLKSQEKLRKTYSEDIAKKYKEQFDTLIQTQIIAKETNKIDTEKAQIWSALSMWQTDAITKGTQYVETELKIVEIENRLGVALDEKVKANIRLNESVKQQAEYYKEIAKNVNSYQTPLQGPAAGAAASGQLGALDPMTAAKTAQETLFNGLKMLRDQDLINEQTYQTAKVNAAIAASQAIMDATKKQYENEGLLRVQAQTGTQFGFESQKQMAQNYADFKMKSDMEQYAFGLDQMSQMMTSLGQSNKKAFEAAKAFNIANAIMNTYMGATKALAMYPPPFNFIAAATVVAAGLAQVASIRSQQYSGRALGGPVMGNQPYIVGENGPELFTPNTTGSITRNSDLMGGGGTTNVNFTIVANDTAGFDQLLNQRKGLITQIIRDAQLDRGVKGAF